ncbi:hypothetical protein [Peribacillus muralis]|uniref:hypothetical protein n=1 Tax=Peribacillus muralis TaxID=264697 RepID=UPI00366FA341
MMNLAKTKKIVLLALIFTLGFTSFAPFLNKAQANEVNLNNEQIDEQKFYEEQLASNPNFNEDLVLVKQQLGTTPQESKVQGRGVIGGTLKAIKNLSPAFRHGGTALSWILKPFSKKSATIAKRNGRKIANAIDKLDSGTKTALENALVKSGVPRSDAKTVVYIIFTII